MANVGDAVVGELVKNLISFLQMNFNLVTGVTKDVEKLTSTLSAIQAVLEDAEATQFKDKLLIDWLKKLKDATYDAEDVLEAWSIETIERDPEDATSGCIDQVSHSVSTCFGFNRIIFRHQIAKKLKNVIGRFDEIANERLKFQFNTNNLVHREFIRKRETSSFLTEPEIYGRDDDKTRIIDLLLQQGSGQEDVSILPIVGFGGVGKTTIAQWAFNNDEIISCFKERIWVCVSDSFDIKRILKDILESFGGCKFETLDSIQKEVVKSLKDKKYLLVLDDLWNDKQEEWNALMVPLKVGAKGSLIMVTTRSSRVASLITNAPPYPLGALSDEDCWSIMKRRALGHKSEEEHQDLVPLGKEIAKKCRGIPLAAKSLGSLLELKTHENHWKHVRDDEIWSSNESQENTILPALRLSYNHLPSCLKQCFSYCSVFPKDSELGRSKLICLWIANGFIQSKNGLELEEVGDDIFHELLHLSFFQEVKEDENGETCKMHDLMHDLACAVAVNECSITKVSGVKGVPKTIRHLSIIPDSPRSSDLLDPFLTSMSSLRSLFFFQQIHFHRFEVSTTLRVLNLRDVRLTSFPLSICQLKHLRHLDVSRNHIKLFPESICKLRNLQMLDLSKNLIIYCIQVRNFVALGIESLPKSIHRLKNLRWLGLSNSEIPTLPTDICNMTSLRHLNLGHCSRITSLPESIGNLTNMRSLILSSCGSLEVLPESIRNMRSLRNLNLEDCWLLKEMPVGIGKLTCLETLGCFVVGAGHGCGGINELHGLNRLRGKLEIKGLGNVRNAEDAKEANLSSKPYLTELCLDCSAESEISSCSSKDVLEGLQLPPNVEKLEINSCMWETCFPRKWLQNLTALTSLKLWLCEELVCLPEGLQNVTSLKKLQIESCDRIKCLPVMGIHGMNNSLSDLRIFHCRSLASLSKWLQYLTSLTTVNIQNCPELELEPEDFKHLNSLLELLLHRLPKLKALPDGKLQYLTSLKELQIGDCPEIDLETKHLQHLISLRYLSLENLPKLRVLPNEGFKYVTCLQTLRIDNCLELELEITDFQHLASLRELTLGNLPKLTALPNGIQHLILLQTLRILECQNLTRLPQGIQHLTALQYLRIYNCHPELHTRCEKDTGEDWHLISHIKVVDL